VGAAGPTGPVGAAGATGPLGSGGITNLGYRYAGELTGLVNFNTPAYSLSTHRVTGRCVLFVNNLFDYPVIRLSGVGDIGSAANVDEQAYSEWKIITNPMNNQEVQYNTANNTNYLDRSLCFSNVNIGQDCQVIVEFTIDLLRDPQGAIGGNNTVIRGRASYLNKPTNGTNSNYKMYTFFERHTTATTLSQISIGTFGALQNAITHASLNLEIIPLPTFI
jgi:hypothetical protein